MLHNKGRKIDYGVIIMGKRIIALLLTFIMVVSMVPVECFADNSGTSDIIASTEPSEPMATETTPAATETTPTATETTPAATETTPAATETTPAATETTPSATENVPLETENVPAATEGTSESEKRPLIMKAIAPTAMAAAVNSDPDFPTDLNDELYLAIYNGSGFPGEPAWYSWNSYVNLNSNFEKGSTWGSRQFASSAVGILDPSILDAMVPGTGSGSTKVWGVFSTSGVNQYVTGGGILTDDAEEKIIKAVKGNNANANQYRVIWYVIKYQTDTHWHIDGLIVERESYTVNYYGNGNTSGSAPTGATGLYKDDVYKVLGNTGSLKNVRSGYTYEFIGWNTRQDGTGTAYKANDQITITGDVTLYAQWKTPTRDLSIRKEWNDDNDRDRLRPESIEVHLLQNDVHSGKKLTLSAAANWQGSWTDVPALDQFGNKIDYFVEEPEIAGYTHTVSGSADDGFVLTNTHVPEKISLDVQKIWNDGNNRDGKRPDKVAVQLYKTVGSGTKQAYGEAVELSSANGWTYRWADLLKMESGVEITYSVEEPTVPAGYTVSYATDDKTGRAIVTNTYVPETIELTATKEWDDDNNRDKIRPDSVQFVIYANGVSTGETITVKASEGWTATVSNLPKNQAGQPINYSFVEETVPEGYTLVQSGTSANDYTVKNKHVPTTRSIQITKNWDDAENQDGKRPGEVKITLYADSVKHSDVILTAEDLWTKTVTGLPYYKDGVVIDYTVDEAKLTDYQEPVISGNVNDGFVVTNTRTPEVKNISVQKDWDDNGNSNGMRKTSIEAVLYINGVASTQTAHTVTLSAANEWKATWTGLPVYSNGAKINYSVVERVVPDQYSVSYSFDQTSNTFTITNTYKPDYTLLNVQKIWMDNDNNDGMRPASVTVWLRYKIGDADWVKTDRKRELNEANEWEATYEGLPAKAFGQQIIYDVVEDAVEGYTTSYSDVSSLRVINVTNTHTGEKTSVSASKVWDDDNNRDNIRASSVTLTLYANGAPTDKVLVLDASNDWKGTFADLDKYYRGREITYTVVERNVPAGYSVSYSDSENAAGTKHVTVTNTHTPATVTIPVEKVWNDDNDRDGVRPASVVLNLLANGTKVQQLTLSASNNWQGSFTAPQKNLGVDITYTVTENAVEDYTAVIEWDATKGYTVTNTHEIDTTAVQVTKKWDDKNNQDGVRPSKVVVHLLVDGHHADELLEFEKDGVTYKQELSAANNWTYTWDNLPVNVEGDPINYTVSEEPVGFGYVENYSRIGNNITVTNTRAPDEVSFVVQKVWDDQNNQDNLRPASVTVQLLADGEEYGAPVTLTEAVHWKQTWTGLPKKSAGVNIVYTVAEVSVPAGYTSTQTTDKTGMTIITNKHDPYTGSIKVTKQWDDASNQDGIRPDAVVVILYKNGVEYARETLDDSNNWSKTWTKLPVHHGIGEESVYILREVVPNGYDPTYPDMIVLENGVTKDVEIKNTHVPETISLDITKNWEDNDDQDGLRPKQLVLTVFADGNQTERTVTLEPGKNWKDTVSDLPKYKDGKAIVYSVRELEVPDGYTCGGEGNVANNYTVTNTHTPETRTFTVNKVWNDNNDAADMRAQSIQVTLYENGQESARTDKTLTLTNGSSWSNAWVDLPAYRNGLPISYTVRETGYLDRQNVQREGIPQHYEAVYTYDNVNSTVTITNTYAPETTFINVEKSWVDNDNQDGIRPDSVKVKLLYKFTDEADTAWKEHNYPALELNEENQWDNTFKNLLKVTENRNLEYKVVEESVANYTATYSELSASNVITITNTHEPEKTALTVSKVWEDGEDRDDLRTSSVTVKLYANGVATDKTLVLKEEDEWKGSFTGLDKYSAGKIITYSVVETDVPTGYTATYGESKNADGTTHITVTNVHTPETVAFPVSKIWDDDHNRDDLRPKEITVVLLANGEEIETVKLDPSNNWRHVFTKFKKENGVNIVYSLKERAVEGYTTSITGDSTAGFEIKNVHTIQTTDVTVTKVWNDTDNQDGLRPEKVVVHLLVDGHHADDIPEFKNTGMTYKQELSASNNWTYTWEDLPVNAEGDPINYTVSEETVASYTENYTRTGNHITITNTHVPERISFVVQKVWNDQNNQDGLRPRSIWVQLKANGEDYGSAVELTLDVNWKHTWTELPKKSAGRDIVYTVTETGVPEGYTTAQVVDEKTGIMTIVNTHTPAVGNITVTKQWDDASNQDGIRPDAVVVILYKNGVEYARETLNASNNWSKTWSDLPVHHDIAVDTVYTLREVVPAGYTPTYPAAIELEDHQDNHAKVTIKNTHIPETVSFVVTKLWQDNNDQDGIRPDDLTLKVLADNQETGMTVTLVPAQNWSATISGLPKYKAGAVGQTVTYTVDEPEVTGYTSAITGDVASGFTITNTHTPKKVKLVVQKIWDDADNNDGARPYKIEVSLLINGQDSGKTPIELSEANNWTGSWDDMDRYHNGLRVSYSVIESGYWQTDTSAKQDKLPDGYSVTHSYPSRDTDPAESVMTITNSKTLDTTNIHVIKNWDDMDNQDGIRPDEISVWLWYNLTGNPNDWIKTDRNLVLRSSGGWMGDFTGLRKKYDGRAILYNVSEEDVAGYTANYSANSDLSVVTIKNSHTPAVCTVNVEKIWDDANDQDGKRPDSVTVTLYANGTTTGKTATLSAANDWKAAFTDLPKNHTGKPVTYRVYEDAVADYEVSYTGSKNEDGSVIDIKVTNTHEPELISIPVKKTWDDKDNQDGIRPGSVEVALYAGNTKLDTLSLKLADNWTGSFEDLPKFSGGEEVVYTVKEDSVPTGYTATVTKLADGTFEIVNFHKPAETSVKVVKVWDDDNDRDGLRPDVITVHLTANGQHADEFFGTSESYKRVLTKSHKQADGTWTYTWENLPVKQAGRDIYYSVYEEPALFKDVNESLATDRYVASYARDNETNTVTITNSHTPETIEVSVHKVWIDGDDRDGLRPEKVRVQLCRMGGTQGRAGVTVLEEIELDPSVQWYHSWNLPKYENGRQEIEYFINEPDRYTGYVNEQAKDHYVPNFYILTSTHQPATTEISVEKVWEDEDDNDGKRPDGIIVQLYADGDPISNGRVVLSINNNWSVSWQSTTDSPLYIYNFKDQNGEVRQIKYTVEEVGYMLGDMEYTGIPNGYTNAYTNPNDSEYKLIITNTKPTEKISLEIIKVWDDDDNNDGKRPDSVTLKLIKNSNVLGETITLDKNNGWKTTVTDLYRYTGGVVNQYAVVEIVPEGYTEAYASQVDAQTGNITITVTNSHVNETKTYTVTKVWRDANDAEKLRPEYVMVQLYKDDQAYGNPIRLDAVNKWKHPVELPLYEDGSALKWSIVETTIPRYYTASYDQTNLTVTNTLQSSLIPKTGDDNHFLPWMIMFAFCTMGAGTIIASDRKKRKKQ